MVSNRQHVQQVQREQAFVRCVVGVNPLAVVTQMPAVMRIGKAGIDHFTNSRHVHRTAALRYLVNDMVNEEWYAIDSSSNRTDSFLEVLRLDPLSFQQPTR